VTRPVEGMPDETLRAFDFRPGPTFCGAMEAGELPRARTTRRYGSLERLQSTAQGHRLAACNRF
jgi:hypothetical protein